MARYRTTKYVYWPYVPEDGDPKPEVFETTNFSEAHVEYLGLVAMQIHEKALIERCSFDVFNEYVNDWVPMFESFVHQTAESHGLEPIR